MKDVFKYEINDNFFLDGIWTDDISKDKSKWVYGQLKHDDHNDTVLKIIGNLKLPRYKLKSFPIMFGMTIEGNIIKAYDVISIRNCSNWQISDVNEYVFLVGNFVIVTNHIDESGKLLAFSASQLSFLYLNEWLPVPKIIFYDKNSSCREAGIGFGEISETTLANFNYRGNLYSLFMGRRRDLQTDSRITSYGKNYLSNISYQFDAFLQLKKNNCQIRTKEAYSIGKKLVQLFELLLGGYSRFRYLRLNDKHSKCNVFPESTYPYIKNKDTFFELSIYSVNYDEISNCIDSICNRWINKSKNLQLLVNNYLLTINNPSTIENELLNISQGVEMYFSNNDQTLLEKLKNIASQLPQTFIESVENCIQENKLTSNGVFSLDEFLNEIKNTRVFLTHGTDRNNTIHTSEKKIISTKILTEMIRVFILKKIGISECVLEKQQKYIDYISQQKFSYNSNIFN